MGRIFYEGDHNDLAAFVEKHPDFFPRYSEFLTEAGAYCCTDLEAEACLDKIRLLVIASMASSLAPAPSALRSRKLSLALVSERLQMSVAEAESLAVRAISLGILDGQIDQLNQDIHVW